MNGAALQPSPYNAAVDLVSRNLVTPERSQKTAIVDDRGRYTYAELAERVDRAANALRGLGLVAEQRVALALLDGIDFAACFLGAIKAGIVPIPLNTLFQPPDFAYILADSRAKALVVSHELEATLAEAARLADWTGRAIVSGDARFFAPGTFSLERELERADSTASAATTCADDVCFWLYSSGSTGRPKGTLHVQSSMIQTADLFARDVLGLRESDVVYSAAKLFFAYGLGNALSFPMAVGATSVLYAQRPTPQAVAGILREQAPTVFCGVPTLYNSLLAYDDFPKPAELALRLCTSAGEALPEEVARAWTARTGVEVVDGIGSTEMLHIFVSNRPGDVRFGTTGVPVPGYRVRIVDDAGADVPRGELGELLVAGPTSAVQYWNNREKTRSAFVGEWTRTGDKFIEREDGAFVHCGRVDDMLKVGGIWVSPMEVEGALIAHPAVL
ncbi:MAG: benzoate-CoA ligase family protein, partial [Candidatus Eremiobacteraeota bacterium]|nr:benzoate-CoA ligase family protein [Candidatus Eremiobacteraeota bacterium]